MDTYDIMLITLSLGIALLLSLTAKGCALLINKKFNRNIQSGDLHAFVVPVIISIVIYFVPKLMVFLGIHHDSLILMYNKIANELPVLCQFRIFEITS
ncbi:hypothetical protein D3C76_833590 [compost metagenome]